MYIYTVKVWLGKDLWSSDVVIKNLQFSTEYQLTSKSVQDKICSELNTWEESKEYTVIRDYDYNDVWVTDIS